MGELYLRPARASERVAEQDPQPPARDGGVLEVAIAAPVDGADAVGVHEERALDEPVPEVELAAPLEEADGAGARALLGPLPAARRALGELRVDALPRDPQRDAHEPPELPGGPETQLRREGQVRDGARVLRRRDRDARVPVRRHSAELGHEADAEVLAEHAPAVQHDAASAEVALRGPVVVEGGGRRQ